MANKYLHSLFIVFLLLLQACNPGSMGREDYMAYCNDEAGHLIQKRTFNAISYSLKYEPIEYKALMELSDAPGSVNTLEFEKLKKEYEGLTYFVFKMENPGSEKSPVKALAKNESDLAKLNQYCQSGLVNNFYLESNGVKIPCVLFHLEDDHSLTNYNLISLAFESERIDWTKDLVFVFDDPFFNSGAIKFNFSKESITKLPTLKLS